jgi:serine/threonine protein kinase
MTTGQQHDQAQRPSSGVTHTVRMTIPPDAGNAGNSTVYRRMDAAALESQYQLIDKIGDGGMGVVYLARDRRLGRVVAIKRLNSQGLTEVHLKERLFQEARAAASLNHIHIVHIYALGEDVDGPFIVMEYIAGPKSDQPERKPSPPFTLADRIHREGPLALDLAIELVEKLCRAIEYAHSSGVVHRDLKPTNVLLDESGEPKIVDFGLARVRTDQSSPLTQPGEKMLSLGYGAPEQEADASLADERADVYGLGALLYFCITGKNPRYFRQNDLPEVLRMPIVKALETDREQRWSEVKALRTALMVAQTPNDTTVSTAKVTWRCKWCDTVNPTLIRFCGKCGWDGGEFCAECGSESRFGTQYCGVCGADAKAYETAHRVLEQMRLNIERKAFALVGQEEHHISGFRPQGANGRRLVEKVRELGETARNALRRKTALRGEIEREMQGRHYERVRQYIEEYNTLSFDGDFDEMEKSLDHLQSERDVERLRSAVVAGHWDYARRLGREIGEEASADVELLRLRIQRHFRWRRIRCWVGISVIGLIVYGASAAPLYRMGMQGNGFRVLMTPVIWLRANSFLHVPLDAYARLFGIDPSFPIASQTDAADPGSVDVAPVTQ